MDCFELAAARRRDYQHEPGRTIHADELCAIVAGAVHLESAQGATLAD